MTNTLINIENISSVDLIKSELGFLPINEIGFIENSFDSGGFGSLHKVISINGKQINGLVVKVISDKAAATHALATISLLHKKIQRTHKNNKIGIGQAYPQLIGMPFCCFNAFDDLNQKEHVGLLMYDLRELGYEDFGSDKFNRLKFTEANVETKIYYSYQLANLISFLHELEFIHSDLSENAIWINSNTENLLLIDYDSGYHFDSQDKPTTLGKVGHWIGSRFRRILSKEVDKRDLTHNDRLAEENWVLANALFELIFGVSPYFFLIDAADGTKQKYLKNNEWPKIEKDDKLLNSVNDQAYKTVIDYFNMLNNNGLETLLNDFKSTFNKGFKKYQYRPSSASWRSLFFEICKSLDTAPIIVKYKSNKNVVQSKSDFVEFNWTIKRTNQTFFNGENVYETSKSISFIDNSIVPLDLVNDFGNSHAKIEIVANKTEPKILKFSSNKFIRDSLDPLTLEWDVENASNIEIVDVNSNLPNNSTINVEPESKTNYRLIAYGNFDQKVESTIEITVIIPEIISFNYEINIEKGIDNVDLHWASKNGISAEIIPMVGSVEPNGSVSKSISEKTTFTLVIKGYFSESSLSIDAKPFPIPIINSLFIPTPDFNLETNFFNSDLGIKEAFVILDPINIDTSINYSNISPNFIALDEKLSHVISEKPKTNYFDSLFHWVSKKQDDNKTKNEINEENN